MNPGTLVWIRRLSESKTLIESIYPKMLWGHDSDVKSLGRPVMTEEFPVVFALYPQVTQLDFTGPYELDNRHERLIYRLP